MSTKQVILNDDDIESFIKTIKKITADVSHIDLKMPANYHEICKYSILYQALKAIPKHVSSLDISNNGLNEYYGDVNNPSVEDASTLTVLFDATLRFESVNWGSDKLQQLYSNYKNYKKNSYVDISLRIAGIGLIALGIGAFIAGTIIIATLPPLLPVSSALFMLGLLYSLALLYLAGTPLGVALVAISYPNATSIPQVIKTPSSEHVTDKASLLSDAEVVVEKELSVSNQDKLDKSSSERTAHTLTQVGLFAVDLQSDQVLSREPAVIQCAQPVFM